jgi:hypothetical protein
MTNEERPTSAQIQTAIMRVFAHDPSPPRRLDGYDALTARIAQEFPDLRAPAENQIMEALWAMLGQGMLYLNYYRTAERPNEWVFWLTELGETTARDEIINPDSPDGYLKHLRSDVPAASEIVLDYATESIRAYQSRCYLASAVMLGVATEAAFLELGAAFASWLPEESGTKFLTQLTSRGASYWQKFTAFRKTLEPKRGELPQHLAEDIVLTLDATLNMLRIYRNEAGHPTGKQISRARANQNLQLFAFLLGRMYELKAFFETADSSEV